MGEVNNYDGPLVMTRWLRQWDHNDLARRRVQPGHPLRTQLESRCWQVQTINLSQCQLVSICLLRLKATTNTLTESTRFIFLKQLLDIFKIMNETFKTDFKKILKYLTFKPIEQLFTWMKYEWIYISVVKLEY